MSPSRNENSIWLPILVLLASSCASSATAQLSEPEFQINTYTTGNQAGPALAADDFGNCVVIWESSSGASSYDLFGQRFDAAGSTVGGEFAVNSSTPGAQQFPAVSVAVNGNFVVVWQSSDLDSGQQDVVGQLFDAAGSPEGDEFLVNTVTTGNQQNPSVAADAEGNFLVVWNSAGGQDGAGWEIFGRRYDPSGTAVGTEFQINTYTTSFQFDPRVAADGLGNFVVVWTSLQQDGSGEGVFGRRYAAAGGPLGGEFQVHGYTTFTQSGPEVAADAAGNFVVVWTNSGQSAPPRSLMGRRFGADGNPAGSEFRIDEGSTSSSRATAVDFESSGAFLVAWLHRVGDTYDLFGKLYDSAGNPTTGAFQINAGLPVSGSVADVAALDAGRFLGTWSSQYELEPGDWDWTYDVFGRRFESHSWIFMSSFESGDTSGWAEGTDGLGSP